MAIQKEFILPNGLRVTYHRLESISTAVDQVSCIATLGSYVDRQHREHVFAPVITQRISFIKKTADIQQDAYNHIKTLPDWVGSIDV